MQGWRILLLNKGLPLKPLILRKSLPRDALNLQKVAFRAGLACTFAEPGPSLEAPAPQKIASQGRHQSLKSRFSCKDGVYFCYTGALP